MNRVAEERAGGWGTGNETPGGDVCPSRVLPTITSHMAVPNFRVQRSEILCAPQSITGPDVGNLSLSYHVAGEEAGFQIGQFQDALLEPGMKLASPASSWEKPEGTRVRGKCPPPSQLQRRAKRFLMGLSGSVENPVSLGCLQANDWGFLCPGISPHPMTQNRLGFLSWLAFLVFYLLLWPCWAQGWGKLCLL